MIEDSDSYVISLSNGDTFPAQLIGQDKTSDLAVLKIDPAGTDLTVAPLGDSSTLRVGEKAIAIGNPLGEELAGSVTVGVISALNREVYFAGRTFTMIQTDAAINAGNSGGALCNSKGCLLYTSRCV